MSKLIDDELRQLIQKTQVIVKQMLPLLQDEVHSIISSRETSEHRIEQVLDRILDCLYSGFGEMEFKTLNIRKNKIVRLQINRKEHPRSDPFKTVNVIGFCVCYVKLADSRHIERFAWHCTPIDTGYFRDHPNYIKFDEIFKKVYLVDMRTYESM